MQPFLNVLSTAERVNKENNPNDRQIDLIVCFTVCSLIEKYVFFSANSGSMVKLRKRESV